MSALRFVVATALMLSSAVAVHAQSSNFVTGTKPRASSGGIADNEMRGIYRDDVGQGYTSSSLNQISLQNARAQVGYFGQSSATRQGPAPSGSGPRIQSLSPSRTAKPFSSVSSSPTVSPYLNLFREDLDGSGDFNYQTLVRPQFQQLATNQQFQRQSNEISQRVQAISAQSAYGNPAGSESLYPTGHQTAFGYYSRFYPGMPQPGKR
jgi:hypothetical protein